MFAKVLTLSVAFLATVGAVPQERRQIDSVFNSITSVAGSAFSVGTAGAASVFDDATSFGGSVAADATSVAGSVFTDATSFVGSVAGDATSVAAGVFQTVVSGVQGAYTVVTSVGGEAITLTNVGGEVVTFAGSVYTRATSAAASAASNINSNAGVAITPLQLSSTALVCTFTVLLSAFSGTAMVLFL
ncbi:hypothetical protein PC9H_003541 [Pleurotus ostreatus]|uniref:Uncharacterized protein n=3 Tax=Pleurotus TaxID=5320 RepID=A0A067P3C2_PLEO1|nr:uncharacterized protein PC9H_003541 [Pleurotus ostreatus]KAF7436708.1 hypothetical protein PC9H_003541 [Pleurotus ostreatus]KAG9222703.1 hypothetical protein CCMSSC00406_0004617 [Pleurotus cornucopiae]KAJ8702474.1 hypothetical protein PTI98_001184 [Pleurotus ostreatus]KDQ30897.1 hypothetical protein PLEOSDRAFT_1088584 [Pleurotus ostreatus PC15]